MDALTVEVDAMLADDMAIEDDGRGARNAETHVRILLKHLLEL